jgi:hypothetical protein
MDNLVDLVRSSMSQEEPKDIPEVAMQTGLGILLFALKRIKTKDND